MVQSTSVATSLVNIDRDFLGGISKKVTFFLAVRF